MKIRSAVMEDAAALALVHIRTWQTTYRGIMQDDFLDNLEKNGLEKRTSRWKEILGAPPHPLVANLVATLDDRLVGFVSVGPSRDEPPVAQGEMYAIYLLKEHQNAGIGRKLFESGVDFMRTAKVQSFSLWVANGNATEGFYLHMGGKKDSEKATEVFGNRITESRYIWPTLPVSKK